MRLGSHNSWSYLPVKQWCLRPFKFVAQCQDVDIYTQFTKYNVEVFDLRVSFDKNDNIQLSHGLINFKGNVWEEINKLDTLACKAEKVTYLRIILEKKKSDNDIKLFQDFCKRVYSRTDWLVPFEGRDKETWKIVCDLPGKTPSIIERYSSVTGTILDDWFPRLYAYCNNESIKFYYRNENESIILMDFINYS